MSEPQKQKRRFNLWHKVQYNLNRALPPYYLADGGTTGKVKAVLSGKDVIDEIHIPLTALRESTGTGIKPITDTPLTDHAVDGLLGPSTTPTLDMTNGDTDSALQLQWIASGVDAVLASIPLPSDLQTDQPITVNVVGKMGGTSDTPTIALESYFGQGDTKVEDVTGELSDSLATVQATIAAADVPAGAKVLTIELTPGAHDTDTLNIYDVYIQVVREMALDKLYYTLDGVLQSKARDSAAPEVDDLFDCTGLNDTAAGEHNKVLLTIDAAGAGHVYQGNIAGAEANAQLPFPDGVKSGAEAVVGYIVVDGAKTWASEAVSVNSSYYEGYEFSGK
jgi:hypothetical protein